MKLLSRCAGRTRAAPAAPDDRARATPSSIVVSRDGAHATEVGQNAVTPYFGRRLATSATASAPSSTSMPSMPWTCTSTKPGTMVWPERSMTVRPGAGVNGARFDRGDAAPLDDDRSAADDAIRQDEVRARRA